MYHVSALEGSDVELYAQSTFAASSARSQPTTTFFWVLDISPSSIAALCRVPTQFAAPSSLHSRLPETSETTSFPPPAPAPDHLASPSPSLSILWTQLSIPALSSVFGHATSPPQPHQSPGLCFLQARVCWWHILDYI